MIQAHRMHIQNLGLFTTVVERVNDYQRLLQTRPSGQQAVYIQLFKEACDSGIKDVALDRMRQKLLWAQGASETTNIVRESLRMQDRRSLRSKRDRITWIDQILPTKPKLKSNKYNKILDTVINFYKYLNNPQMLDDLTRSYEHYLKLNPSLENEDPEHNLVKCYLFLAFAKDESDEEKAYRYSKRLIEANESLEARSWLDRESRYVLCWAARRLGRFDEADECGKIALQSWPYDPRFYHGLALNAYSCSVMSILIRNAPIKWWMSFSLPAQQSRIIRSMMKKETENVIEAVITISPIFLPWMLRRINTASMWAARDYIGRENTYQA